MTIVYCTSCGAQNAQGARFCNYCGSAMDLKAAAQPGMPAPQYPPPYAPPPPQGVAQSCEQRNRQDEECMGQTRIPGLVVFAIIVMMVGIFALIQWIVDRTWSGTYSGVIWPLFGIALALVLIGVWSLSRQRAR